MNSPIAAALAAANKIFMTTRRDGATTPTDDEVREFGRLADRLYKDLGCTTGGPLHAQLEDGNTNHLIGQCADDTITQLINAMRIIASAEAPAVNDYRFKWEYQLAHYYQHKPEALQCATDILAITRHWGEDDANTIHGLWSDTIYGPDGWLARRGGTDA